MLSFQKELESTAEGTRHDKETLRDHVLKIDSLQDDLNKAYTLRLEQDETLQILRDEAHARNITMIQQNLRDEAHALDIVKKQELADIAQAQSLNHQQQLPIRTLEEILGAPDDGKSLPELLIELEDYR
jgi:hypothetical protein